MEKHHLSPTLMVPPAKVGVSLPDAKNNFTGSEHSLPGHESPSEHSLGALGRSASALRQYHLYRDTDLLRAFSAAKSYYSAHQDEITRDLYAHLKSF